MNATERIQSAIVRLEQVKAVQPLKSHKRMNAELGILRRWLEYRPLPMEEPVLALADAILGPDPH